MNRHHSSHFRPQPGRFRFRLLVLLCGLLAHALGAGAGYAQILPSPAAALPEARKLAPPLRLAARPPALTRYRVQVSDSAAFGSWAARQFPAVSVAPRAGANAWVVTGRAPDLLQRLTGCPWITFVDVPNREPVEERVPDRPDGSLNNILAVHATFPALNGAPLALSIKERPFDKNDIDFKGRVIRPHTLGTPVNNHASTIATLAAGGGNSAPASRGVAWGARLAGADFTELMPDHGDSLLQLGVSVQNHSYGVAVENYYGLEAAAYDGHCRSYPALVHVFSAGNRGEEAGATGPYAGMTGFSTLTGQFKQSKNTLCVGATDEMGQRLSLSSYGPAHDGRIKPELVAYAGGGTSEAAALASGVCLLVQQAYGRVDGGRLPPASLVKAALVNSARDTGRPGLDFETGFGSVDALGAVRAVQEKRFRTGTLAGGQEQVLDIAVPPGSLRLKATLVWHDPEALPGAGEALVNDLDLLLVHEASGQRFQPWVLSHFPSPDSLTRPPVRGTDRLNNVEQVSVAAPPAGRYQVRLRGHRVVTGTQAYSLVFEVEKSPEWTFPVAGSSLRPAEPALIRWDWPQPAPARLEYRLIGRSGWLPVDAEVTLAQTGLYWTPPASAGPAQLRLVAENGVLLSDTFMLSQPPSLSTALRCTDRLLLRWKALAGVTHYQVYRLGEAYLEPFRVTSDTTLTLDGPREAAGYYAVAPVVAGGLGERSFATTGADPQQDCYVRTFALEALRGDTARLRLQVAAWHQLASVELEKWYAGGFYPVRRVAPVAGPLLLFTEKDLPAGRTRYRARLTTTDQKVYYSQPVDVLYALPATLRVFPNPVRRGQVIGVVSGDAPVRLRLFDGTGRLLLEQPSVQSVIHLSTEHFSRGIYQVCLLMKNGAMVCRRITVL